MTPETIKIEEHPANKANFNEIWRTRQGNLAMIVHGPFQFHKVDYVGPRTQIYATSDKMILWYDRIDRHWTVSEMSDRLYEKTDLTPAEFFANPAELPSQANEPFVMIPIKR